MPRRGSLIGPIILIGLGVLFLYGQLRPGWSPWPLLSRYWPVILIALGLGKLWDHFRTGGGPERATVAGLSGGEIAAIIVVVLLLAAALSRKTTGPRDLHHTEVVERQDVESVRIALHMAAGNLTLAGGASKLLEASFDYSDSALKPEVTYEVTGNQGRLSISEPPRTVHFGRSQNQWNLRFGNDVPMELKIEMGAGHGDLRLTGLPLSRLDIEMGAGQLTVDLTGDWNKDLDANIQGGVGNAIIRLPKDVGVRVHATGGIGAITANGLKREEDAYVNDAYRKSPVTLRLNVEGGVGTISLELGS